MGLFEGQDRRPVVVVITSDGRRLHVPAHGGNLLDVPALELLRSLLAGLEDLLGLLITGSRRENGGTRKDERD